LGVFRNNLFPIVGKEVSPLQFFHVSVKLVAELKSNNGNEVNPGQLSQQLPKAMPSPVFNIGKDVS